MPYTKAYFGKKSRTPWYEQQWCQQKPVKIERDELLQISESFIPDNQIAFNSITDTRVFKGVYKDEQVAIKRIQVQNLESYNNEKLISEIVNNHPNIVTLLGYGQINQYLCLVYELKTRALKDAIGDLNWEESLKIIKQIVDSMNYLADKNIVHGDLNPRNILLDDDNDAYICDFGASNYEEKEAKTFDDNYSIASKLKPKLRLKHDVYSVGVIILEMVMRDEAVGIVPGATNKSVDMMLQKKIYAMKSDTEGIHISAIARVKKERNDDILHSDFKEYCDDKTAKEIVQLGIDCTDPDEKTRPTIETVMKLLSKLK